MRNSSSRGPAHRMPSSSTQAIQNGTPILNRDARSLGHVEVLPQRHGRLVGNGSARPIARCSKRSAFCDGIAFLLASIRKSIEYHCRNSRPSATSYWWTHDDTQLRSTRGGIARCWLGCFAGLQHMGIMANPGRTKTACTCSKEAESCRLERLRDAPDNGLCQMAHPIFRVAVPGQ